MIDISSAQTHSAVRWPFRALAALFFVVTLLTIAAFVLQWRSVPLNLQALALLWLPGLAYLSRFFFHAAVYAKAPGQHLSWPFASESVLNTYFVIALVATYGLQ